MIAAAESWLWRMSWAKSLVELGGILQRLLCIQIVGDHLQNERCRSPQLSSTWTHETCSTKLADAFRSVCCALLHDINRAVAAKGNVLCHRNSYILTLTATYRDKFKWLHSIRVALPKLKQWCNGQVKKLGDRLDGQTSVRFGLGSSVMKAIHMMRTCPPKPRTKTNLGPSAWAQIGNCNLKR